MTNGGDAAEQLIRVTLNGAEVVLRLTGAATKELATFLVAALNNPQKKTEKKATKYGETRLKSMLQCDKPTEIFSVKEGELKKFVDGAKKYGILYCVVKNPKDCPDNLCDIMVKADDAPKIRRIAERYNFSTLSTATVEHERDRAVRAEPESEAPNKDTAADLANDLLGEKVEQEQAQQNPDMAKTKSPHPSAPLFGGEHSSTRGSFDQQDNKLDERKSTRKALQEIKEERKRKADVPVRHEPQRKRTNKSKNRRGAR